MQISEEYIELRKFLDSSIPQPKEKVKTFFDIAGFPHYETVISNFYAYYLNPEEEHNLNTLFFDTLIQLINKKIGKELFTEWENILVIREFYSTKGNSIDLVITDGEDEESNSTNAVIIENKIYADVYNDLQDYYESVKAENKIGILLSLYPSNTQYKNYINITHSELLDAVLNSQYGAFLKADEKQMVILKDFVSNLRTITGNNEMKESIKFCFENGEKLSRLLDVKKESEDALYRQADIFISENGFYKEMNRNNMISFSTQSKNGIMLYLYFDKLFTEKIFFIKLWLKGEDNINKWKSLSSYDFLEGENVSLDKTARVQQGWLKLSEKEYSIDDYKVLLEFSKYLNDIYYTDWESFEKKLNQAIIAN